MRAATLLYGVTTLCIVECTQIYKQDSGLRVHVDAFNTCTVQL